MKSLGRIFLFSLLALSLASSCKKDESSKSLLSMSGTWKTAEMDKYIRPLAEIRFDLETSLATEDGTEIVYTYTVTGGTIKDSTALGITFVASKTCMEASVKITAEAKGYVTKSITRKTTIVDPSYVSVEREPGEVEIGGTVWLRNNLENRSKGLPYLDEECFWDILGGFYTVDQLEGICPEGFTLPTLRQWDALFEGHHAGELMSNSMMGEKLMWNHYADNIFKLTDALGFSALPCGYATRLDSEFYFFGYGDYACFWVMDEDTPLCVQLYADDPSYLKYYPQDNRDFAANVRCVRK